MKDKNKSPKRSFKNVLSLCFKEDTPMSATEGISLDTWPPRHPRDNLTFVVLVFIDFLFVQILINIDSGAVPAVLDSLTEQFQLNETLLGVLGAIPYLGLIVASPIISRYLQAVSQKRLLIITIFLNILGVAGLAVSYSVYVLYGSKIVIGLTQAAFVIYFPVWVDEFAPERRLTLWMAFVQACNIFGVTLGYFMASFIRPWRNTIIIQGCALTCTWIAFIFTPRIYTNLYDEASLHNTQPVMQYHTTRNVPRLCKSEVIYGNPKKNISADGSLNIVPEVTCEEISTKEKTEKTEVHFKKQKYDDDDDDIQNQIAIHEAKSEVVCQFKEEFYENDSEPIIIPCSVPTEVELDVDGVVDDEQQSELRQEYCTYDVYPDPLMAYAAALHDAEKNNNENVETPMRKQLNIYTARRFTVRRAHTVMALASTRYKIGMLAETSKGNSCTASVPENKNSIVGGSKQKKPDASHHKVEPPMPSMLTNIKRLVSNEVYIWTVFTLSCLIFVYTGVQYWATEYFATEKHADITEVRILIAVLAATAPTVGVFFGSFFIDFIGGYRSTEGVFRALWFCFVAAFLSAIFGVVASFLDTIPAIGCIWFLLCFAASLIPPALGMLIASVPPSLRAFASAFSMFTYNLFGYALGIFLPGPFIHAFGLNIGMKVVFFWACLGTFGGSMALIYARKHRIVIHNGFSSPKLRPPRVCGHRFLSSDRNHQNNSKEQQTEASNESDVTGVASTAVQKSP